MEKNSATPRNSRPLWIGAAATALAAGLFPRLNAVLNEDVPIWQFDPEARVLLPIVVVFPLLLFAFLGRWAWRDSTGQNRPAKVGLICGALAVVGFLAFFLSLPIAFGGLALTLGVEGRRRAPMQGHGRHALIAMLLGAIAAAGGIAVWLVPGGI